MNNLFDELQDLYLRIDAALDWVQLNRAVLVEQGWLTPGEESELEEALAQARELLLVSVERD